MRRADDATYGDLQSELSKVYDREPATARRAASLGSAASGLYGDFFASCERTTPTSIWTDRGPPDGACDVTVDWRVFAVS